MAWQRGPRTASSAVTKGKAWHRVRAIVLARDGHACQLRLSVCIGTATQVDHSHAVAHGGATLDPDQCIAVCVPCHKVKTAQDAAAGRASERRPTEAHPGILP